MLENDNQSCENFANQLDGNIYNQPTESLITSTLDKIVPDEDQPRKDFSNLEEMIASIKNIGLQKPINVIPMEDGNYKIIDGERRYRAMKKIAEDEQKDLSQVSISVFCRVGTVDETVGFIMNLIRDSYSPMEIARGLYQLKNADENLTNKKIGERIGKSQTNVTEYLSLLKLPQYIQEKELGHGVVPFHRLKELAVTSEGMTDEDKILKYNTMLVRYSKDKEEINEAKNAINAQRGGTKTPDTMSSKRFANITKKLDATAKSIAKFDIEKISSPDDRRIFVERLDAIIAEAQEKKARLEKL